MGPPHPHMRHPEGGGMPGAPGAANQHVGMHPQQQMHPRPDITAPFSEQERVVVGNRVTVPNLDNRPNMGSAGYGAGNPAAAAAMAAAAAAAGQANMAAAANVARQQYAYGQHIGYDYSTMYNAADWQQYQMQSQAFAAALNNRTTQEKPKVLCSIWIQGSKLKWSWVAFGD